MRERPTRCDDRHGDPLLLDLDPEIYLSDSYAKEDIGLLTELGLGLMYMEEVITCAERDLAEDGTRSRIRSRTDND